MTYQYTVRDALGKTHEGTVEAESRDGAAQALNRDGFHVIRLEEGDGAGESLFPRRVSKHSIIYMTSQLAIMVDTGINLAAALDGIRQQEENPTLKRVLGELKSDVEAGDDFSTALSRHPKHFDRTYIALVRASEHSGTLGEMLDQIANYMRSDLENRGKVRAALAYPCVMLCLAVAVTIFLLTYILPKFEPLFHRKGVKLPSITVFMMTLSDLMIEYWYLWITAVVLLVVGFAIGRRTDGGRKILDWIKLNVPVMGPLSRKVTISRSIRTLGAMVRSGVPMLDAVKLTADVSGNYFYERSWQHVLDEITNGRRICEALAEDRLFPNTLVQMIGSGEETGKLDYVLTKVSTHYDREVETSLKTVTSLLEPLMIVGMGVVVGAIGLGLLLPIFSLSRGG